MITELATASPKSPIPYEERSALIAAIESTSVVVKPVLSGLEGVVVVVVVPVPRTDSRNSVSSVTVAASEAVKEPGLPCITNPPVATLVPALGPEV